MIDTTAVLAKEFSVQPWQVQSAVELMDEGCTIPFIARYRKEKTGSLDDQLLRELADRLEYLRNLEKRKEEVLATITEQEKLTPELQKSIENAVTLAEVEDLYRPFKPKRKTRASVARERGLEPLARLIEAQKLTPDQLIKEAQAFVNPENELETPEQALEGAKDILAEELSDNAEIRGLLREYYWRNAQLAAEGDDEKESVYRSYYHFSEPVAKLPGHRILAIDRGEREGFLKVSVTVELRYACGLIEGRVITGKGDVTQLMRETVEDSFTRLIHPSLERETRSALTEQAAEQAIKVFAVNLEQLLMQPPVKGTVTLGLDPAYRTGCKIAVVDQTGKVVDTTVIYPTPPQKKVEEAKRVMKALIKKHGVTTIAIGNGTASRESEQFVAELLHELDTPAAYMIVSEAGASVYSASKLAAEEFPEYDVSLRSAVSIARRLQDPLAELVKIDPQAIGVGQYQHDMPKKQLSGALSGVVEHCVNTVGVDLNTASHSLLSYVAGINGTVAKNILAYREENGMFHSRKELLKVPKLGKKAFEQCAGFLRVPESDELLDHTAVHPESYPAAKKLLKRCKTDPEKGGLKELERAADAIGLETLAQELEIGAPTLRDMIQELTRPGRDPRDELPKPVLRTDVLEMKDLKEGMVLTGTVRNVIDFGAFVDIGVHEDGLVHISQICNRFIRHPSEVLKVGDVVKVKVLGVDLQKKRISLTMKQLDQ